MASGSSESRQLLFLCHICRRNRHSCYVEEMKKGVSYMVLSPLSTLLGVVGYKSPRARTTLKIYLDRETSTQAKHHTSTNTHGSVSAYETNADCLDRVYP